MNIEVMTLQFYQQSKVKPQPQVYGAMALRIIKLLDAGFPVPKGFIVSGDTCRAFFANNHLKDKILLLLERTDYHNPDDISRIAGAIRKLIMAAEMPGEISQPLLQAAIKLGRGKVMLTPSPITPTNDLAESLLGLSGEASILLGIRELWANLFTTQDLYIISSGEFPCMAICVQAQPQGIVSGTLLTSDGDKAACQIKAVFGEGGYIHSLQGADSYQIERSSGQEKDKARNLQTKEVVFEHGVKKIKTVPPSRQKKQKLSQTNLLELAKLADKIHRDKFFPQEASFVFDGKKVFLIDVRAANLTEPEKEVVTPSGSPRILLKGLGMTPGIVTGLVRVVRSAQDIDLSQAEILVASKISHLSSDLLRVAKGVILEEEMPQSAVIQFANRGIALLMKAAGAVDLLEPGTFVTLHTPRGEVLAGGYRALPKVEIPAKPTPLATHVGTNLALGSPTHSSLQTLKAHLIVSSGVIQSEKRSDKLFASSVFRSLSHVFESLKSPLLIYHLSENPRHSALEIQAIEQVRRESYGRGISVLLPRVRTAFEVLKWQRQLTGVLPRSASLRYYLDLSIPSMLWQLPKISTMVDGVVLDLDQLAKHLFATDFDTPGEFQLVDLEPVLLNVLELVAVSCREQGLYLILRGQMMEHDPYLSFVVTRGIHEVNVPESLLISVRERLAVLEQELVSHV